MNVRGWLGVVVWLAACGEPGGEGPRGGAEDVDRDGFTAGQGDCDDTDPDVNPGAVEVCDAADVDEDCDDAADDADPQGAGGAALVYADADDDGWGDAADPGVAACEPAPGAVTRAGDCRDDDVAIHPDAAEACNGLDDDCDDVVPADEIDDADQDGSPTCLDCAPDDAAVFPGAPELCDGVASGCPLGVVPADELDGDLDGYVACAEWVGDPDLAGGDCDDTDVAVHPAVASDAACDGVDADCDGTGELLVPAVHPTIQAAVTASGDGDEVCIAAGTYYENVVVTTAITLTGVDGAEATILDGGALDSALIVDDAGAVTVRGLTLTHGSAVSGGGLLAQAGGPLEVVLDDCVIADNDADGGAGIASVGATLVLVGTDVTDNVATGSGGGVAVERCNCAGGPLTGGLEVLGGTLAGNRAADDGGGLWLNGGVATLDGVLIDGNHAGSDGGGVYTTELTELFVIGGTVSANDADLGGGLLTYGPVVMEDVTVTGNEATESGGGGLLLGDTVVDGGSFTDNVAEAVAGGLYVAGGYGAYYYGGNGLFCDITGTVFERNTSQDAVGGLAVLFCAGAVTDVTATDNASDLCGGVAILDDPYYGAGGLTATRVTAAGNVAFGDGGGAYLAGITVTDPVLTDNVAGGYGGGAYVEGAPLTWIGGSVAGNAAEDGGGIAWVWTGGSATGVRVEANVAVGDGGGLVADGNDDVDWTDVEVWSNEAGSEGGGFYAFDDGVHTFETSVFADNVAEYGGGLALANGVLENVVVAGNAASRDFGGVVALEGDVDTGGGALQSDVDMFQCTVVGNSAVRSGGGVYNLDVVAGSVVAFNDAALAGGGVVASAGLQRFSDVYGNSPDDYASMDDPTGTNGNVSVDPFFVLYDPLLATSVWDLHPDLGSPLLDAGNPAQLDPDGSVADIGAYGGPGAAGW